ncbi:MAG TPA: glycoside hydrolase family 28 protein [Prolixibacteraceae bacterium]|nr:glycoside hydrolase family 28 protein [Prolixibacteraceae bacterium]
MSIKKTKRIFVCSTFRKNLFGLITLGVLCLNATLSASGLGNYVNIVEHGADPTGRINVSHLANQLIDSLNRHNGGTLFFPAGTYLSGPIFLKSNITLLTESGTEIHFSDNFDDYLPMVTSRWEGVRVKTFASPLYAIGAENIAIKGEGHFEGHGKKWWDFWYKVSREGVDSTKWQEIFKKENSALLQKNKYIPNMHHFLRPPMVMFYQCKDITIEGVSFSNPAFWTIVPTFSENITIHNITIENPGESPNTDGIDPSSCRNVRISDCHISVGDDCIVLKSGRDEDGREANVPTENITITNCTMLNGHGGVVIGSEMSGSVKRVTISNCVFEGTDRGIRLKSMRGRGGIIEDIRVSNIVMRDIVRQGIMINMRYQQTPVEELSERTPLFRRIHISDVNIIDAKEGISIYGLEERSVEQLSFNDLYIQSEKGIWGQYAHNVLFENIRLETPAQTGIQLDRCEQISIIGLQMFHPVAQTTGIDISKSGNIRIMDCFQTDAMETFLKVEEASGPVYLMNNVLPGVRKVLDSPEPEKINQLNTLK